MLEKSNTWPEQVLDTLNSCWRALLESLSNTQANVGSWSLALGITAVGMTPTSQKRRKTMGAVGSDAWQKLQARYDSG